MSMTGWLQAHWIHLLCLLGYLTLLARHAWLGVRHVKTLDDYLVAGRQLGGLVVGLSFYATFMSTNTFIGAAGKSWDVGLIWCVGGLVHLACCGLSWFVVAPRFVPLTREYESLTVADFLGSRYRSPALRRVTAVIVFFASVAYLVAIYRGSALALSQLLDLPQVVAIVLVFVVVTAYTLMGGFSSVVATDAVQGVLMVVGAVGLLAAVLVQGGGVAALLDSVRRVDPQLISWQGHESLATILAISLAVGIKYLVEPRQLSRFYGLRDAGAMRTAAIVTMLLVTVSYVCLLPLGALARAIIPAEAIESSDQVVPFLLGATNVLGPYLGVLFLVVLLSAAMSSIDSVLLVAASTVDHDLVSPEGGGSAAIRRTRLWVVIVSAASMLVAISPFTRDIMTVTAFSGSLYGACFLPALVVGLFWRKPHAVAALASVVVGAVTVIGWFAARALDWTEIHEVYPGLVAGLATFLLLGRRSSDR